VFDLVGSTWKIDPGFIEPLIRTDGAHMIRIGDSLIALDHFRIGHF
jgi:hypothetical protein